MMNTKSESPELNPLTVNWFEVGVWFTVSVSIILIVTGLAKVWSVLGDAKILTMADPIIGISFGHLMLALGVLEIVIASICLFARSQIFKLGLVAWLATIFVLYRFGLWCIGWHRPCSCLGNLTDALHIPPEVADNIMKLILAYLLIGSYGLLFWQGRQGRRLQGGNCDTSPSGTVSGS